MDKFRSGIPSMLVLAASAVLIVQLVVAVAADDGSETFLPLVDGANASQPFAITAEASAPILAGATPDVVAIELETLGTPQECVPNYSPMDDSYLCWIKNESGVTEWWLVSPAQGLEKLTQDEELYTNSPYIRAYDKDHLVFVPRAIPPLSPEPQPVYLLDLTSGEKRQLGETVRGWLVNVNATGYVTFLGRDSVVVVNPILGTKARVPLAFDAAVFPTSSVPLDITPEPEPTWPAWLLVTPEVTATALPPTPAPIETPTPEVNYGWASAYPSLQALAKASPDGKRVALAQITGSGGFTTLSVVDVVSGQRTVLTNEVSSYTSSSFDWSPDGRKIVYGIDYMSKDGWVAELWLSNADGSERRLIWQGTLLRFSLARWLPGSDFILFGVDPGGYAEENISYRVINVNGGEDKEIMVGGNPAGVAISSDGHRILRYVQRFTYEPVVQVIEERFVVTELSY